MSITNSAKPVGILTAGTKFYIADYKEGKITQKPETAQRIMGLKEVPELSASKETIETTTLDDSVKTYIFGLGDAGELAFKFTFDNSGAESNFRILKKIEDSAVGGVPVKKICYVELPDGTGVGFPAVLSCKIDAVAVNAELTFTLAVSLQGEMDVVNPA